MTCKIIKTFDPSSDAENLIILDVLQQIDFYLTRIKKNILLINAGPNAKIVSESKTTLFVIAAREYGNANLWTFLADSNMIYDPEIREPVDILIPPLPSNSVEFGVSA